jgi:hypothetical protein
MDKKFSMKFHAECEYADFLFDCRKNLAFADNARNEIVPMLKYAERNLAYTVDMENGNLVSAVNTRNARKLEYIGENTSGG